MWAIKVLSGPQAGQIFPLKPGKNTLGRAPTCEIKLASSGVSKEHAQIFVTEDKLIVSDLSSRNGTFVNGVRIQNQKLSSGDKLMLHDLLMDIVQIPNTALVASMTRPLHAPHLSPHSPPVYQHHHAEWGAGYPQDPSGYANPNDQASQHASGPMRSAGIKGQYEGLLDYFENVAMPGIYQFARKFEYRWLIMGMVSTFILMVTAVSVIPTLALVNRSIQEESQRRARTIARNLAALNRTAIIEKAEMSVTVRTAELEDGVTTALIISAKDGSILAPANLRGSFDTKAFVQSVRRSDEEMLKQIDGSTIGSSVPIVGFNSETQMNTVLAYAVVIYDMSAASQQQGRAARLFFQIFAIAMVFGVLLYVILIRVIERPLEELNARLDDALREGSDELLVGFQYPKLEALASNISSALARIGTSGDGQPRVIVNRDAEAMNIVSMMSTAAIGINAIDERVILSNPSFDRLVGGGVDLRSRPLTDIPDSSLQQQLRNLMSQLRGSPDQVATGEIPFMGEMHMIRGQTVSGEGGEPAYYIVTIRKAGFEEAA